MMVPSAKMPNVSVHSGKTVLAGVIGWPITHSLSPRLHGYWLNQNGIDGAYLPLAVHPDEFDVAIRGLIAAGFKGVNVTVPHKQSAAAISDTLDAAAKRMDAVNTLIFQADGSIKGSNTDGLGFVENMKQGEPGWNPKNPALVFGAGGAARGICFALLQAGCTDIRLVNRTHARAVDLADSVHAPIHVIEWENRQQAFQGVGTLINTTTQGMVGHDPLDVDLTGIETTTVVTDIVYNPLDTPLLTQARLLGCPIVDGIGMLLHQARPGFAAWFGVEPVVDQRLRDFVLAGL